MKPAQQPAAAVTAPYGIQGLQPMLEGVAEQILFDKEQVVLFEHERLSTVVLIVGGVVKVRSLQADGSEEVLGLLGRGECVGIASVFGASKAWGDVVAITPVTVLRLPKEAVIGLILEQPEAAIHFMAMMAGSLNTVRERVLTRHLQPSQRVLQTLTELARKAEPDRDGRDGLLAPILNQMELAALTGVARETCCRCLSQLQRKHLIEKTEQGWWIAPTREGSAPNRQSIDAGLSV